MNRSGLTRQVAALYGKSETACMLRILLVAEFGPDHIKKVKLIISRSIFSEIPEGMKLKCSGENKQHFSDQQPSLVRRDFFLAFILIWSGGGRIAGSHQVASLVHLSSLSGLRPKQIS